jgi:hypothetical protein
VPKFGFFIFQNMSGGRERRLVDWFLTKGSVQISGILIIFFLNFAKIHEKKPQKHTPKIIDFLGVERIRAIILSCLGLRKSEDKNLTKMHVL